MFPHWRAASMSSDRLPLFRIRRGWRTGSLVPLGRPSIFSEETAHRRATEATYAPPREHPWARAWNGNHKIDLRVSIPVPGGRWYVTVVAGPERRSYDRLRSEGQMQWLRQSVIYIMMMALILWITACAVAVVYLMKSALGIDIFEGDSPLHFIWDWMFAGSATDGNGTTS